jgi:NADH:ubiquinone oxidoreductase subunit 2 (subunit N)
MTLRGRRLRSVLVLLLGSLAGLPPFVFFFAKVGLLSALFTQGAYTAVGLTLALVLFSWYTYLSALRLLAQEATVSPLTALRQAKFGSGAALVAATMAVTLLFGSFFLDDLALLVG